MQRSRIPPFNRKARLPICRKKDCPSCHHGEARNLFFTSGYLPGSHAQQMIPSRNGPSSNLKIKANVL